MSAEFIALEAEFVREVILEVGRNRLSVEMNMEFCHIMLLQAPASRADSSFSTLVL
jgi:hypothetical protein